MPALVVVVGVELELLVLVGRVAVHRHLTLRHSHRNAISHQGG